MQYPNNPKPPRAKSGAKEEVKDDGVSEEKGP
jgi:hypothetical protein